MRNAKNEILHKQAKEQKYRRTRKEMGRTIQEKHNRIEEKKPIDRAKKKKRRKSLPSAQRKKETYG